MKAKDKAKELVDKYINLYPSYIVMFPGDIDKAEKDIKQCALIAVDEILDASLYYFDELSPYVIYWQQVKQEIEKL
jgi:hypothetical protein